jgi:hypothetical protein
VTDQDQRCCGRGVCIINEQGQCWCGQVWDGKNMITAKLVPIDLVGNLNKVPQPEKK